MNSNLRFVLCILSLCGTMLLQPQVADAQETVRIGVLVAPETPMLRGLMNQYGPKYAVQVSHTHMRTPVPTVPVKAEVYIIPAYGQPSTWIVRDIQPAGEYRVPRNLIGPGTKLCVRVYGVNHPITNDPAMDHQKVGTESRYSTCSNGDEFWESVRAGRTSDAPDHVWRMVVSFRN